MPSTFKVNVWYYKNGISKKCYDDALIIYRKLHFWGVSYIPNILNKFVSLNI